MANGWIAIYRDMIDLIGDDANAGWLAMQLYRRADFSQPLPCVETTTAEMMGWIGTDSRQRLRITLRKLEQKGIIAVSTSKRGGTQIFMMMWRRKRAENGAAAVQINRNTLAALSRSNNGSDKVIKTKGKRNHYFSGESDDENPFAAYLIDDDNITKNSKQEPITDVTEGKRNHYLNQKQAQYGTLKNVDDNSVFEGEKQGQGTIKTGDSEPLLEPLSPTFLKEPPKELCVKEKDTRERADARAHTRTRTSASTKEIENNIAELTKAIENAPNEQMKQAFITSRQTYMTFLNEKLAKEKQRDGGEWGDD